ncbi:MULTISPECIES: hypothetical protein [Brevibacillus]|uniref:Uncharacterized protein n=1 Tax=Brevibacillus panacihumi W25 TaxID=1408254 RepID=V6M984_9BACL|nr:MULTISPECIES: hypothetical protein [Brevibacillus]EST52220.1 hypothetical protein T458_26865 [Brevibacillus panacihumi W25]EST55126.1 hypothetical protein T458_08725 [Brevibacillus panacihumi W25]
MIVLNNDFEKLLSGKFEAIGVSSKDPNKVRFYCYKCRMIFDRIPSVFKSKLKNAPFNACPGCNSWWRAYESIFFETLNTLDLKYVMPQYTDQRLRSHLNRPLRFDAALFENEMDIVPYCVFEINDYHHFTWSNQGNLKTYYKQKVAFCRDILQVPLIELDYRVHFKSETLLKDYIQKILTSVNQVNEIKDEVCRRKELERLFFNA